MGRSVGRPRPFPKPDTKGLTAPFNLTLRRRAAVCTFPSCGRKPRTKNGDLCEGHYYQRRRGTELRPLRVYANKVCTAPDCTKPPSGKYCSMHRGRKVRHGDFDTKLKPTGKVGSDNANWVGDNAGYFTVHERLRNSIGSASTKTCVDCGTQAQQWSYDHTCDNERSSDQGPFSTNLDRYSPRCVSCHKTFDLARM